MPAADVLVVEEDATLTRTVIRNLVARGYVVRNAATVAEALIALRERVPALLLLDIDLPDGSGWEVLRGLCAPGHREVQAIVLPAKARLVAEPGCVARLENPFLMESLLRLVAQGFGRPDASLHGPYLAACRP